MERDTEPGIAQAVREPDEEDDEVDEAQADVKVLDEHVAEVKKALRVRIQ